VGYVLTEIASGENNRVFMDDNHLYRLLPQVEADFFLKMLFDLKPNIKESVVTTVKVEHDIGIQKSNDQTILAHKKIKFISYPHEWCASMLKDAALFHLKLQQDLLVSDLFLKDAHPWNILFEKGKFTFVDLPSIITKDKFATLDYIPAPSEARQDLYFFNQIMTMMFIPYFIMPLCGYAYGKRSWVKKCLETTTLNASTDVMNIRDCLPPRKLNVANCRRAFRLFQKLGYVKRLLSKEKGAIKNSLENLYEIVESIDVKLGNSDYKNYYSQKGESNPYEYNDAWNAKQKNVHHALKDESVISVMDVACNTGWYSIMAEKLGKQVVALDYDEACIEELYSQTKEHKYNILPIWSSFLELTKDRFSITSGKKVLIDFSQRMRCDAVIALGILHHLVLGMGLTFEEVLIKLSKCAGTKLVVEFVSLEDEMVEKHPDFFAAYHQDKNQFAKYNIDSFIECGKRYFSKYEILTSYPETRSIVVFEC